MKPVTLSHSCWISCPEEYSAPVVLKKIILAPGERAGEITVSGLGYYELFVNGRRVGEDYFKPAVSDYGPRDFSHFHYPLPGEETSHRIYCNVYDLSAFLTEGDNTLAVLLGNGFYRQTRRLAEGDGCFGNRLLCRFELAVGDRTVGSDGSEICTPSFITENNLFFGETQDFSSFDEGIFSGKEPRSSVPVRVETLDSPLYLQGVPCDRVLRILTPSVLRREGGKTLYDLGVNTTGTVCFTSLCEEVSVLHAEKLTEEGDLLIENKQPCENRYLHAAGRRVHPWFNWSGFRYFEITGEVCDVEVFEICQDLTPTARFECGNETLNWLFETYLHTQLVNMHGGVPSDCPHRERLGYTGDGQLTCESALLTLNSRAFYEKWIADIADCQDVHSGHVQHTAPFFGGGGGPGGWGGAMVIVPYTYYRVTGDLSLLARYYSNMTAYLDCMATFCEDGLVVKERKDGWCLGDWCTPGPVELPEPFVNTYYYLRCMTIVEEISALLDKPSRYASVIETCKAAMISAYFDPASGDFCGGVQGANAFGLMLGLGNEKTKENLLSHYRERGRFDTGIFGTDVLCDWLVRAGEAGLLCRLLTAEGYPSFGFMRRNGATTLWEYWEGKHSHNHPMFGGCVKQLFYGLCGISADVGFRHLTVAPPLLKELGYVKASLSFPHGRLDLCVTYEGGKVSAECRTEGDLSVEVRV